MRRRLEPQRLLTAFLEELEAKRYYGSREQARHALPRLLAYLKSRGVGVKAVTEADLMAYARQLTRQKTRRGTLLSRATQAVHITAIRRFFAFLEHRGEILQNPAVHLPYPREQRIPRTVLSEAQAERLIETPPATTRSGRRDRAILELLYGTGIRIGECARIDGADLDLAEGRLLVRDGKGRKDRVVPITGRAHAALAVYLKEVRPTFVHDPKEPALFLSHFGTRLKAGSLYVQLKGHAKAAELNISPHGLRHACATHLLQHGADIRHIQELLGHSQLQTTALYTRVNVAALRGVLDQAHPRSQPTRLEPPVDAIRAGQVRVSCPRPV
jgi:integrase/recombinase XerD